MMYSCALWDEAEGGVRGDLELGPTPGDLESAQRRKIHRVLRAARVKPGHRILEFGSGWGGLAIEVSTLSIRIPFIMINSPGCTLFWM
jgi:cyclopropane-fatty-acyl-phospholipid synthase